MPSITRRGQQSRRAQRRDEIRGQLLAAVEAALEDGSTYTELSVERLVQDAGVSRSTFYVYFQDKSDLLRALVADVFADLIEASSTWWNLPPSATKDELRDALSVLVRCYRTHQRLMGAVIEVVSYDEALREQFMAGMEVSRTEVAKHIRAGQKQGFVHDKLDADHVAAWLTWMAERGLHQLVAPVGDAKAAKYLRALTDIVWNTLYEGTAKRSPAT